MADKPAPTTPPAGSRYAGLAATIDKAPTPTPAAEPTDAPNGDQILDSILGTTPEPTKTVVTPPEDDKGDPDPKKQPSGAQYWKGQAETIKAERDAHAAELEKLRKEGLEEHRKRIAQLEESDKELAEYKSHAEYLHFRESSTVKKLETEFEKHAKDFDALASKARKPRDWYKELAAMRPVERIDALTDAGLDAGRYIGLVNDLVEKMAANRGDFAEAEKRRDAVLENDQRTRMSEMEEAQRQHQEFANQVFDASVASASKRTVAKLPPGWDKLIAKEMGSEITEQLVNDQLKKVQVELRKVSEGGTQGQVAATQAQVRLMAAGLMSIQHFQPALSKAADRIEALEKEIALLKGHAPDYEPNGGGNHIPATNGSESRYAGVAKRHNLS